MRGGRLLAGLFAALWALAAPCGADQIIKLRHLALVVPTGSPVRYASNDGYLSAKFTGTFVLTGVYHIAYTRTDGDGYSNVWFEPDASLVSRLPYWRPYKQHASQITFDNTQEFLKAVRPGKPAGRARLISGRTAIRVSGYQTGVECDWPWFTVHFLSLERTPVLLAGAKNDYSGC